MGIMDIEKIRKDLENCPCGKIHTFDVKRIEISETATERAGEILRGMGFSDRLLFVADQNTLTAARGLEESLTRAGFILKRVIYPDMKYARAEQTEELENLSGDVDGIISVGTGSLNDICRVAAAHTGKPFCIYATAPSMDGFASDTAPIIQNNFKTSWQAVQPDVIIADTNVLAAAPDELKSAGFGDMMAKYVGLADWKIAHLLIDEYYCDRVANLTQTATDKIASMADRVLRRDADTAGAVMESLCMTGLAMKAARSSRPASGAEHVVSHYLECHKVLKGIWPEYHGKKVGVATVVLNRAYRNIAESLDKISAIPDVLNMEDILSHYAPELRADVIRLNTPTVTERLSAEKLTQKWDDVRKIILDTLPTDEQLLTLMHTAGAATTPEQVNCSPEFFADALNYHPYMRYRMLLTRLMPMIGKKITDFI